MNPSELHRLRTLFEAAKARDLARLDAALREDRALVAEIVDLASIAARDLASGAGTLPLRQQALRQTWADQRARALHARRMELAAEIARLRQTTARSVGKHEAIDHLAEGATRDAARERALRAEDAVEAGPASDLSLSAPTGHCKAATRRSV